MKLHIKLKPEALPRVKRAVEIAKLGGHKIEYRSQIWEDQDLYAHVDCLDKLLGFSSYIQHKADIEIELAQIPFSHIVFPKKFTKQILDMLETPYVSLSLGLHTLNSIVAVSKTIAKLEGSDVISLEHVAEAIQYQM